MQQETFALNIDLLRSEAAIAVHSHVLILISITGPRGGYMNITLALKCPSEASGLNYWHFKHESQATQLVSLNIICVVGKNLKMYHYTILHKQCPGRFLGIIGQDLSVSKSNRLHVVIFRFFFINLRNIPQILLKLSEVSLRS